VLTLLSFEDEAVPLVGAEMMDGLIIFFLCGVFGWTGTPTSFQVVSRALRIGGAADLYVDDLASPRRPRWMPILPRWWICVEGCFKVIVSSPPRRRWVGGLLSSVMSLTWISVWCR
jgi:hypothetical protein